MRTTTYPEPTDAEVNATLETLAPRSRQPVAVYGDDGREPGRYFEEHHGKVLAARENLRRHGLLLSPRRWARVRSKPLPLVVDLAPMLLVALLLGTLLSGSARAQSAPTAPAKAPATHQKPKPFVFDYGDAAYLGSIALDTASSYGKQELNPLYRGADGRFSVGKNLAAKGLLYGAIKLLEWHYDSPRDRRTLRWFKVGVAATFTGIAVHNFRIGKR